MLCPICKKSLDTAPERKSPTFPFCSERCKLIDLGRWLDGKYQVSVSEDESPSSDQVQDSDQESSDGR